MADAGMAKKCLPFWFRMSVGLVLLVGLFGCGDGREECSEEDQGKWCIDDHRYRECAPDGDPGKDPDYHVYYFDCRDYGLDENVYCVQRTENYARCTDEAPE